MIIRLIKDVNIWAVLILRFSGPFLIWARLKLRKIDQKTSK